MGANMQTKPVGLSKANSRENKPDDPESDYLRELLQAVQSACAGDFSARLPTDLVGLRGKIADAFNDIISYNERMAQQLEQVGQIVGREGKTRTRVRLGVASGAWGDMEASVNALM